MILSVHQPQYIPWIGYFDKIARSDHFVFLDTVQYKHREFQNRNKIRTDRGALWLTVPVLVHGCGPQTVMQVRIDRQRDWQRRHFESIKFWYAKAPFLKDHLDFMEDVYNSRTWERLMDLNVYIIKYLLDYLSISTAVSFESKVKTSQTKTERIIELCKKLKADTYLSGAGGKDYLDEDRFEEEGIALQYQNFQHPIYHQQFMGNDKDFMPYMSVLDLILNEGHDARKVIGLN
jgi:hypothetical protein